jgi:cytochrome c556
MKFGTKTIVGVAICLSLAVSASAAPSFGDSREAAMKKISRSTGVLVNMLKGKVAYDPKKVKKSLSTISATIKLFPSYFPVGSENADRAASPKIWAEMDKFTAHANKLASDADTAMAAIPADASGLGPLINTLGANCSACHQDYRMKN